MNEGLTKALSFHFENSSLSDLKRKGWFFFGDSTNIDIWYHYNDSTSAYLVFPTLLGDSWINNRDYSPHIINILAHSIKCGECCEIHVKIIDYNPYQRYQQAGFFLYPSNSELPSLRYTFAASESNNHVNVVLREAEFQNKHLIPTYVYRKRSLISNIRYDTIDNKYQIERIIDSIVLKVVIDKNNHYFYSYKVDNDDFIPVSSNKLELDRPKYIGLAGFQGRPDIPYPSYPTADILEPKFEYVLVKNCE